MTVYLIIFIALTFSAFFSGLEIAFISSNKLRIALDQKQGTFSSKIITLFTNHSGQYIATMLVGNNIALVFYGLFMASLLEPWIGTFVNNEVVVLLIQTIISAFIILVTAEFLPKTLFRVNPNLSLNLFSLPLVLFFIVFFPFTWMILKFSDLLFKVFFKTTLNENENRHVFNKVDLVNLISELQNSSGDNEDNEADMKLIQNTLDFSKVKLRDCLIPRTDIVALEINSSVDELKQKFIETGLSKILIFKDNIDNIIGYTSSKELFKNLKTIKSRVTSMSIVPETMPARKLLRTFIQEHKSIAVVVDEFGGTAGMVTIEDIIEEIFGEIVDEHDKIELTDNKIGDNKYVFSGRLEIDYINEKYQLGIPESDEYETVAGYILFHHESIPKNNESITIGKMEIIVLKMDSIRIELLQLVVVD